MKTSILLSTMIAPVLLATVAQADINVGYSMPNGGAVQGNCDLLATNTVRATFQGIQEMAVPSAEGGTVMANCAVFKVIENLAHRRHSRYGDGPMPVGMTFHVELSREIPGQPADIVDTIAQLKPGDETVMRMDHLFLYGEPEGCFLRPCARMARREIPQPAETEAGDTTPAAPSTPAAPATPSRSSGQVTITGSNQMPGQVTITGSGQFLGHFVSQRRVRDRNGNVITQEIEVVQESVPGTNEVKTRMFINGVEVDPQTQQPLPAPAPEPQPAPAPAAPAQAPVAPATAPAVPAGADDDTILESESF